MDDYAIAKTIMAQIGAGSLMTVGAHDFGVIERGLAFKVRLHPFKKDGERSEWPRIMLAKVFLNYMDTYDVTIYRGQGAVHWEGKDIYCDQLAALFLAMDFDGAEVLNPRYWP